MEELINKLKQFKAADDSAKEMEETIKEAIEQLQEKDKEIESAYWKGYIEREKMSKEICLTGCKYRKEYFTKKARQV